MIFNEEALLALCFFCFIFFSFNSLGDTAVDIFQSRAAKFEADLLLSFDLTKQSVVKLFNNFFVSRGFGSKFKILFLTVSNYLNVYTKYSSFKLTRLFYSASLLKLSELSAFGNKLVTAFQNKSVSLLLYPLIFQTAKSNISLLAGLSSKESSTTFLTKVSVLKSIS